MYILNNKLTFSIMTHNNKYNETSREELEAYQEKQFEDYLRLNPVDENGNFEEETDQLEEMDHPEFANCEDCGVETKWDDLMCHKGQWFCASCTCDALMIDIQAEEEMNHPEFDNCEHCGIETKWDDLMCHEGQWFCGGCTYDALLLNEFTKFERSQLYKYADYHKITIDEAIYYQTYCHCCGIKLKNRMIDDKKNAYCNKRCQESCEYYQQVCHKEAECRVCTTWIVQKNHERRAKYNDEYHKYKSVLFAIDAFQELQVYNQFFECIPDLIEYFA